MKTISNLLIATFFLAFVGAAMAFRINDFIYVHDPNDSRPQACTQKVFGLTTLNNGSTPIIRRASTTATTSGCPLISVYEGE